MMMHILATMGLIILAYLAIGFLYISLLAKFEIPTNYDTHDSRWCDETWKFVLIWLSWPVTIFITIPEQVIVHLARGSDLIENYVDWLRREKITKRKNKGIEA